MMFVLWLVGSLVAVGVGVCVLMFTAGLSKS